MASNRTDSEASTLGNASRYRKKPVIIEARQLTNDVANNRAIAKWCGGTDWAYGSPGVLIKTLEGDIRGDIGDWIIKGVKGEFYPCKPDIFQATYEAVGAITNKDGSGSSTATMPKELS